MWCAGFVDDASKIQIRACTTLADCISLLALAGRLQASDDTGVHSLLGVLRAVTDLLPVTSLFMLRSPMVSFQPPLLPMACPQHYPPLL